MCVDVVALHEYIRHRRFFGVVLDSMCSLYCCDLRILRPQHTIIQLYTVQATHEIPRVSSYVQYIVNTPSSEHQSNQSPPRPSRRTDHPDRSSSYIFPNHTYTHPPPASPTPYHIMAALPTSLFRWVVPAGIAASLVQSSIYDVKGGTRAVIFDRLAGVKEDVVNEGTHFLVPWLQRAIVYDVRTRPRNISTTTGSKDLQMVTLTLRVLHRPEVKQLPKIYQV